MALKRMILIWICLVFPFVASAEFYRYRDAQGVLRFTDNLAEVPEDQRPKVYKEIVSKPEPASERTLPDISELSSDDPLKEMLKKKAELETAARDLENKRAGLEFERSQAGSQEEVERYTSRLEALERSEAETGLRTMELEKEMMEYQEKQYQEKQHRAQLE